MHLSLLWLSHFIPGGPVLSQPSPYAFLPFLFPSLPLHILLVRVIEGDRVARRALGEEASYVAPAPILGRTGALRSSSWHVNARMRITYGAASSMVAPLAVPTATAEVAGESYTSREGSGKPAGILFHPGPAANTRSRDLSTSALDKEGVDV